MTAATPATNRRVTTWSPPSGQRTVPTSQGSDAYGKVNASPDARTGMWSGMPCPCHSRLAANQMWTWLLIMSVVRKIRCRPMATIMSSHASAVTTSATRDARGHRGAVVSASPDGAPEADGRTVATVPIGDLRRRERGGPRAVAPDRPGDRLWAGVRGDAGRDAPVLSLPVRGRRGRGRGRSGRLDGVGGGRPAPRGLGPRGAGARGHGRGPLRR